MSSPANSLNTLVPFRKDLQVFPGPPEDDGTPTYCLFDPVKGQYYKISWAQAVVVRIFKPGMSVGSLVHAVNSRSSLQITEEDVMDIFKEAVALNLLSIPKTSEQVQFMSNRTKVNWFSWFLMYYLYIRIPLSNPDHFLERTLCYVKPLVSKPALFLYAFVSLMGISIVFANFEKYRHTFSYFFNLQGIFYYLLAISVVKIAHEYGHAYAAKYFGVHVPTMGVALLVLWPVLYTNVTNAWKLKKRWQRLAISLGGVSVEIVIAGLATFGWAVTQPGFMHSIFFLLSSSTWITSVFINLNPAMRFDGYYVFCDIIGFDNLMPRAFAMSRWHLRKFFLGLSPPPPEEDISPRMQKIMIVYSIYTWIYRILLYTAIAWFVYSEFTKALGIFLFIVEVSVFLIAPFASEFKQLWKQRSYFSWNPRVIITGTLVLLFLFWFVVPLPHDEYFAAITEPVAKQKVYIPANSTIKEIFVKRGEEVKKGQPLILLVSRPLDHEIESTKIDIEILKKEISLIEFSSQVDRSYLNTKLIELELNTEKLKALEEKKALLLVESTINGKVYEWNEYLRPGLILPEGIVIGTIGNINDAQVICFVPEQDLLGIYEGQEAYFRLSDPVVRFKGKIQSINYVTSNYLKYPLLASVNGGSLPVIPTSDNNRSAEPKFKLMQSYYEVIVSLDNYSFPLRFGQTGSVEIEGPPRSKFFTLVNRGLNIFWQQSGF